MRLISRTAATAALAVAVVVRAAMAQASPPGAIAGRVVDERGVPLADATVGIVELQREVLSGADGRFRFGSLPAGSYTLTTRRIGYTPVSRHVVATADATDIEIALVPGALQIEPVNVTASRNGIAAAGTSRATSVLTAEQVHREGGISLAHSIERLPGVRAVTSGRQIGKPMIRGLFGPRVLVLANGSRMEDYSWSDEDGPSIDARLAQRVEVVRGPSSVLYGSDALSGVVNVVPQDVPSPAGQTWQRGVAEGYVGSNNLELGSALGAEGVRGRYGWRATATGRVAQNYRTPSGDVQNSSFWAFNGDAAIGRDHAHGTTTLRLSHYGGEFHLLEATGPEPGDPQGGPVRQAMDERLQLVNEYVTARGLRFETRAQWQLHRLAEVSDECAPQPCTPVKDQQAFALLLNTGTVDLLLHHGSAERLSGTVGVSGLVQMSSSDGPIFIVPSASAAGSAVFALEELAAGPLTITVGARADQRRLSAKANPQLAQSADDRSWTAATAEAGVVLRVLQPLALVANVATGWRAPTLFDLYANGPNLAEARYERGDPAMRTERSRNVDSGLRLTMSAVRAEAVLFESAIDDFIYVTPTADSIGGLPVFQHTQADARMHGGELSFEAAVTRGLTLRASRDVVFGSARKSGQPLPMIPPARTTIGVTVAPRRTLSFGIDAEQVEAQARLAPHDVGTGGYTLVNLEATVERRVSGRPMRFDVDVRNATNVTYRDFLSRYKGFADAPGANIIIRVSSPQ